MSDLIWTVIVGGLVGWIASRIMKTSAQMGVLATIVVGIVGSTLGSWIFSVLGLVAYGAAGRFVMAVAGAIVLIWLLKGLRVLK